MAEGVEVLYLHLAAQAFALEVYRYVYIAAHGALFHVSIAYTEIANHLAEVLHKELSFLRFLEVRLGHNLQKRSSCPVVVAV